LARRAPSYEGLAPASPRASAAARGSSRKTDTRCEVLLRRALWSLGCRYRKNATHLPGKPDIVFPGARLAVFCDGDFWHGRDWRTRKTKLQRGTNAAYWIAKIERNMARDRESMRKLERAGWKVVRLWERDILADPVGQARVVESLLCEDRSPRQARGEHGA
jgi:DNA mismatch endonuclease (patch repair protein)